MTIHTFGDSHSYAGWDQIPNINIHHLGPKLCFSIGRDGISIKDGFNVTDGDMVVFCFGEIDCRCHIYKYITEDNDYKHIIDSIVESYFVEIKKAVSSYSNLKTAVYNVVPPIQKYNTLEAPEYPYLGTDEERKAYVLYFNEKIKQQCMEYNYIFFDIYNKFIDKNGFLSKSLSDGTVHINNAVYIREFIEGLKIKK
jgi:hypothetical protein